MFEYVPRKRLSFSDNGKTLTREIYKDEYKSNDLARNIRWFPPWKPECLSERFVVGSTRG